MAAVLTPAEMHELADELELAAADMQREAIRKLKLARVLRDKAISERRGLLGLAS